QRCRAALLIIIMIRALVFLFWQAVSLVNGGVQQSPQDLIKHEGNSTQLQCRHNIPSHTIITWYKQSKDSGFTILGYTWNKNSFPEDHLKDKISLAGNGAVNGSLTIKDLKPSDSTVYYCAASL
ncbi:hypothetical protein DNTS_014415, partial [Danionella cerebrum]